MKIALCFYGLPRLIEKCYPDIYSYFIENNDCDIYAHFWWDDLYKGKTNRLHVTEKFGTNENPIEIFNSLYKPKDIIYEECPNFHTHDCLLDGWDVPFVENANAFDKIMGSFCAYTLYSRHLSMKKSFDLIKNENTYDLIIVLRPDLLLFKNGRIINDIYNLDFAKNIYMPSTLFGGPVFAGEHPNRLGDWFQIGNHVNVKKFIYSSLDIIINKKQRMPVHNQERHLFFVKNTDIFIKLFDSCISVRRFIVEEFEDPSYRLEHMLKPEFYINAFSFSRESFNNNELLPFYTRNITTFIGDKS